MKTMKKALAILLSALMMFSLCGTAFAENPNGYKELPKADSDELNDGDYWYDVDALLAVLHDTGMSSEYDYQYTNPTYYLSLDGNTLRIKQPNGSPQDFNRGIADYAWYFDGLALHGGQAAGVRLLPTSPEGLAEGAYWFDMDGFVAARAEAGDDQYALDTYPTQKIFANAAGTALRVCNSQYQVLQQLTAGGESDYQYYFDFVKQVEAPECPHTDFTYLNWSSATQPGWYWIDRYSLKNETGINVYGNYGTRYSLCVCGNKLHVEYLVNGEWEEEWYVRGEEDAAVFFRHIHVMPEFEEIPTTDADLDYGDYWFDAEGFISYYCSGDPDDAARYRNATWLLGLSDDMPVLRAVLWYEDDSYEAGGYYSNSDFYPYYEWAWRYLQQAGMHEHNSDIYLYNRTDYVEPGGKWYDAKGLAAELGNREYAYASYYLCTCGEALQISVYLDGEYINETHILADEPTYAQFLKTVPAFGDPLPTSEEGLVDGDQWFDLEGFVNMYGSSYDEANQASMLEGTGCLSEDGTILRFTWLYHFTYEDQSVSYFRHIDSREDDPGWYYLRTVGVDPNAGFVELPTQDSEDFVDGTYWFDKDSLVNTYLRFVALEMDPESEEYAIYAAVYQNATFWLNEETGTLRMGMMGNFYSYSVDDEENLFVVRFLRRHGQEAMPGYTLIPNADSDDLNDGDYYFDMEAMIEAMELEDETAAYYRLVEIYLSDDANRVIAFISEDQLIIDRTDEMGAFYFGFLRQHGVDPFEGYELLALDTDSIPYGGWYLDFEAYFANEVEEENARREAEGQPLLTEEEIAANRAEELEQLEELDLYFNTETEELMIAYEGVIQQVFTTDIDYYTTNILPFIRGYDPWIGVFFTTDDISAGDYWMDLESFLGEDASDTDFSDFLVSNRVEVLPNVAAIRVSVAVDDVEEPMSVILAPEGEFAELYAEWAACIYLTFADSKESTCKVAGYEDAVAITKDGETVILVEGTPLDLADHTPGDPVKENDHPATCNDYGSYEMVTYCTACGDELSREPGEYDAHGPHDFGEWQDEQSATCTEDGVKAHKTCAVCQKNFDENDVEIEDLTIPAGHTPGEAAKENDVASTCKELGSYDMVVRCTVCREVLESEHIAYTEYGAHKFGDMVREQSATCTAPGVKAHKTCSVCEKNFDAEGVEIEDLVIPQRDHTPGAAAKENDVPSTCKELGSYDLVVRCTECRNVLESEHIAYTEYADHTPKAAVKENDTPSTCEELGSYESVVYCSVCGDEISRETVDYTEYADHTPGAAVKENVVGASCTDAGSYDEVIYCAVCGNEISRTAKTVPAAGHTWGDWTVIREATEAEDGLREHTCSVCGVTESETFADTTHVCLWCGEIHTGFVGFFVSIWHSILFIFARFTGLR